MIKAIIFDFDGVILESADIKTRAFKELFSDYPYKLKEIIDYHIRNGGISRYVKFRYIYETILGKKLSKEEESELGERFSEIALEKILRSPFVPGAIEFLNKYRDKYNLYVISGTPKEELDFIIQKRGLANYFKEIHGLPKEKPDIIFQIIRVYNYKKDEVVYIGDAESDRIAAERVKISFIERCSNLEQNKNSNFCVVKDLTNLAGVIDKLDHKIKTNT